MKTFFLFYFIFFLFSSAPAGDVTINIINQSATSLTIQASFPEPKENTIEIGGSQEKQSYLYIDGLPLLQQDNFPVVPYATTMFSLAGEKVSYKIVSKNIRRRVVQNYLINVSENTIDNNIINSKNDVEISYHGLFRDVPLFNLNIFPVKVDAVNNRVEYIQSITLEISLATTQKASLAMIRSIAPRDKVLLNKLLLNAASVTSKTPTVSLAKISAETQRYKSGRFKILIDQTGLYQITYEDLINYQVPVEQFDTRKVRITHRGQEIPIYFKGGEDGVFDPGDYFEFWAEKTKSPFGDKYPDLYQDPFTDINIYWLEVADKNGLRMVEESGALTVTDTRKYLTPRSFTEKIHFEQDNQFVRFGSNGSNIDSLGYTMDYWFYDRGVYAVGSRSYTAFLPYPYKDGTRSVFVKAMMRGLSVSSKANPLLINHQVDLWLNDAKVASSGVWKDQNLRAVSNVGGLGISQTSIVHGNNQLRVIMDQAGVTDIAILNWFDVTYQRRYRAHEDYIKFKKQDNLPPEYVVQFEVDGFKNADIELYKLGISKMVNNRIDYNTADDNVSSYRISFQDEIFYPDIEYVALTPQTKKKPLDIKKDNPWQPDIAETSLLDPSNAAEYIIITHELFYENALQLKTYREQTGLKVAIVKVEDIYDEFNFGIKSPLAIKNFLSYAYHNWNQSYPLLYVTLIGSASYNYRTSRDLVPTFLFETEKYGAAASDFQYTLISGNDNTPDLIITRIPVQDNSEFSAYFDKIVGYESTENIGEWSNKGLFISGNDASSAREMITDLPAFRAQNQRIINMNLPAAYFVRKLNTVRDTTLSHDPNFGGKTDLINYFDDGVSLINFFGHGGGGVWADVKLFDIEDVDRLNNNYRLPFITSMTCFTGAFESSTLNGIAEKLIVAPEKGAIGMFAASGVGWLHNDFALAWDLIRFLLQPGMNVGEATLFAKLFYLNNNLYVMEEFNTTIPNYFDLKKSMVNHYNLLGDPFISITPPQDNLAIRVDNSTPTVGDTVHITIEAPFISGSGRVELSNENNEPVQESFLIFSDKLATASFSISDELADQRLYIKAIAVTQSGDQGARGQAKLAVNKAILDSVVVTPRKPQVGDLIYFSAYITSPIKIASVRIMNIRDDQGRTYSLGMQQTSDSLWSSQGGFGPYSHADTISYDVQITDSSGAKYLSRLQSFSVRDPRPDLKIVSESFAFNGISEVGLALIVKNDSDIPFSSLALAFYSDSYTGNSTPFAQQTLSLQANETQNISLVVDKSLLYPNREFYAVLDPSNNIAERNESNNIAMTRYGDDIFNIPYSIGTTSDGINNDTLSLGFIGRIYLPAQGLSASSVLKFQVLENSNKIQSETQPGFTYLPFKGRNDTVTVKLDLLNHSAKTTKNFYLEFMIDTSNFSLSYLANISICRYNPDLNRWVTMETDRIDNRIISSLEFLGEFALFHAVDDEEPKIEITVDGRNLHQNMLVAENPNLAFILQDNNGIDLSSGLRILVDDDSLTQEEVNMPDSLPNANAVSILATPKLSSGNHNLMVQVSDTRGNMATKSIDFVVASDFDLQVYGNYPNPFEDITIISFQIVANGILDDLSIKIYTVAGRLIREIDHNTEYPDEIWDPGYHEIEWDGRDVDGSLVANGVYFAILQAKFKGETIEHTLKLAKLK